MAYGHDEDTDRDPDTHQQRNTNTALGPDANPPANSDRDADGVSECNHCSDRTAHPSGGGDPHNDTHRQPDSQRHAYTDSNAHADSNSRCDASARLRRGLQRQSRGDRRRAHQGVNIALGTALLIECPTLDVDLNGEVTVNELLTAVNHALNGCLR